MTGYILDLAQQDENGCEIVRTQEYDPAQEELEFNPEENWGNYSKNK
jgi:hypothetical protein